MPTIDVVVESNISLSTRARQVCGMFDCPPQEKQRLSWKADLPIESREWNIGLIVGPSGCGKSTVAAHLWPKQMKWAADWSAPTVIDAFTSTIEDTSKALGAVGFNTIPAWLRPFHVLSNGEKFRVEVARRMMEQEGLIVIDEFTSVVDRQVAKIASHAVQKYVRKEKRQLVAVTCHADVIDWLQPDWVFEPTTGSFAWRLLQRRPTLDIEVARVPFDAWRLFAPFHYMSKDLNKASRCFGLWCNGTLAAFAGVLHRPHATAQNIKGLSRLVTLPDYQGVGLGFVLSETLGAAYKGIGQRFRNYPAHPQFIRAYRNPPWVCVKKAGSYSAPQSTRRGLSSSIGGIWIGRASAVFEYVGPSMPKAEASRLLNGQA